MSGIPEDVIERVRDTADIVEVIGEHVELKRTGSDYRGPCPFHGGAHRNFAVIPKKQMFYCFVCHEAGDVFSFLMKRSGLEYPAAIREVAGRYGISIPERPTGGPDPREPLFTAVSVAGEWYAKRLRESDDAGAARSYLAQRGFDLEKLGPLGLGYAPRGNDFVEAMTRLGIENKVLVEAGLAVEREEGGIRPRFWNRVLFPIRDLRGWPVGFGGRVIGNGEPKYLNSPESQIFHKGRLLYNLHDAKPAIRKSEQAVVVEGYFDVLRLIEVGVEGVVAPLGTSLTGDQAKLLKRYTTSVIVLYDSDSAGLRATFRAGDELLRAGLRVSVATLPEGQDPDTLAAEGGADAVDALLRDAIDVLEREIQLLERKGWLGTLSGRRRALDRLMPTIRAANDPVTRDLYLSRTAEVLGVSRESVGREVESGAGRIDLTRSRVSRDSDRLPGYRDLRASPERELLRVMLHAPEWRVRIEEALPTVSLREPEGELLAMVAATDADTQGSDLLNGVDGEARVLFAELIEQGLGETNVDAIVGGALNRLRSRKIAAKKRAVEREMTVVPEEEKVALLRKKVALNRESRELGTSEWNVIRRGGKGSEG